MEAIRIVLAAAASMLVMMVVIIISSASAEFTEEEPPSPTSTTTAAAASAPLHRVGFHYTMQFHIGNTAVSGIADTGSDLIWTNNSQLFDALPDGCPSSCNGVCTFCNGVCTFGRQYGGTVSLKGVMGQSKLTFESSYTTPDLINIGSALVAGCHLSSAGGAENEACKSYERGGMVGLGRGSLSLVSQLRLRSFSYCLPHHSTSEKTPGQIKFNDKAAAISFDDRTTLETTQGFEYPASSRYYVGLKKIQVDSASVDVHNGCFQDDRSSAGDGGMVIDSGTSVTTLPSKVFNFVKQQVEELIKNKINKGEELKKVPNNKGFSCYQGATYPNGMDNIYIVLHFCDGGRMQIPAKNYFFPQTDSYCLAFLEQQNQRWLHTSILGAYQQQDMHMLFDIEGKTLSFVKRSACGQSQEKNHATM